MVNHAEPSVALDVDGVLLDFLSHWHAIAMMTLKRAVQVMHDCYDLQERYGLSDRDYERVWAAFHDEPQSWRNLSPLPNAPHAVRHLREHGFRIIAITGIDRGLHESRTNNLVEASMPVDEVICTGEAQACKQEYLTQIQPYAMADDLWLHVKSAFEAGVPYTGWIASYSNVEPGFVAEGLYQTSCVDDFARRIVYQAQHEGVI